MQRLCCRQLPLACPCTQLRNNPCIKSLHPALPNRHDTPCSTCTCTPGMWGSSSGGRRASSAKRRYSVAMLSTLPALCQKASGEGAACGERRWRRGPSVCFCRPPLPKLRASCCAADVHSQRRAASAPCACDVHSAPPGAHLPRGAERRPVCKHCRGVGRRQAQLVGQAGVRLIPGQQQADQHAKGPQLQDGDVGARAHAPTLDCTSWELGAGAAAAALVTHYPCRPSLCHAPPSQALR